MGTREALDTRLRDRGRYRSVEITIPNAADCCMGRLALLSPEIADGDRQRESMALSTKRLGGLSAAMGFPQAFTGADARANPEPGRHLRCMAPEACAACADAQVTFFLNKLSTICLLLSFLAEARDFAAEARFVAAGAVSSNTEAVACLVIATTLSRSACPSRKA